MNESWCTCEWVMAHIWMRHGAHVNESWSWCTHIIESYKSQWVMSQIWMSHVTNMNESCHIHEWVMSHIWVTQLSHITHNGYYDTHLYRCNHTYIHQFNTHTHTSRHSRTAAPRASARTNHTHTLQHPATLYNILHHSIKSCNTILNPATLYNTLQHSITSCNTRWPPSPHAHTPHWRTAAMRAHYIAIHTLQHFVTPFTTHTYTRTSLQDCSDMGTLHRNTHPATLCTPVTTHTHTRTSLQDCSDKGTLHRNTHSATLCTPFHHTHTHTHTHLTGGLQRQGHITSTHTLCNTL